MSKRRYFFGWRNDLFLFHWVSKMPHWKFNLSSVSDWFGLVLQFSLEYRSEKKKVGKLVFCSLFGYLSLRFHVFFFRPKCGISKYVVVHGCGFKKNWGWENDGWKTQPCALMTRAMSILSRWKMHLDVDDILVFASNDTISIGLDSLDLDPKIYQIQMFICLLFSNTHHSRSRHSFCEVAVGRPSFCLWGLTFFQSQNEKWRINLKVPSKLQPADSHPSWVINLHTPKN